jgi:formate dehydrogenase iron-sulfur subunit
MSLLSGREPDVAQDAGWASPPARKGFFTDTSVCIGCKACEVACKEWNAVPEDGLTFTGMSYDNTQGLGADTWRHVAFIEQRTPAKPPVSLGMPAVGPPVQSGLDGSGPASASEVGGGGVRWLMSSDVCKHCTHAACLDVCPTGALVRTEFGLRLLRVGLSLRRHRPA